MKIEYDLGKSK